MRDRQLHQAALFLDDFLGEDADELNEQTEDDDEDDNNLNV